MFNNKHREIQSLQSSKDWLLEKLSRAPGQNAAIAAEAVATLLERQADAVEVSTGAHVEQAQQLRNEANKYRAEVRKDLTAGSFMLLQKLGLSDKTIEVTGFADGTAE